ncbi:hypothetical protein [Natrinema caseinilyticum]|uniref:hypothetical protein n=1 Tax=Natrinema caseinilyticum TaxID=2961570 RepID=UPI0020C51DDD|nr:hypothetical protein [Natrinema caseinilyticum]
MSNPIRVLYVGDEPERLDLALTGPDGTSGGVEVYRIPRRKPTIFSRVEDVKGVERDESPVTTVGEGDAVQTD